MWNSAAAILIGLITGSVMSVATSCVWGVLQLPAWIQDRFRALSPFSCAWGISTGLLLASLRNGLGFSLHLPAGFACVAFVAAGMFVGMLASALGEIMEVMPVLVHRFRLGNVSHKMAVAITVGKAIGAIIACLVVPFQ